MERTARSRSTLGERSTSPERPARFGAQGSRTLASFPTAHAKRSLGVLLFLGLLVCPHSPAAGAKKTIVGTVPRQARRRRGPRSRWKPTGRCSSSVRTPRAFHP